MSNSTALPVVNCSLVRAAVVEPRQAGLMRDDVQDLWAAIFAAALPIQSAEPHGQASPRPDSSVSRTDTGTQSTFIEECVQVVVCEDEVGIVVRDASLAGHAALQAAFAVAQDLTGRRDALRHLIVNGRTVYRLRDEAATPPSVALLRC